MPGQKGALGSELERKRMPGGRRAEQSGLFARTTMKRVHCLGRNRVGVVSYLLASFGPGDRGEPSQVAITEIIGVLVYAVKSPVKT